MLKRIGFVMMMFLTQLVGEVIQAAEDAQNDYRPKASLYQFENGGDYIFVVHAGIIPKADESLSPSSVFGVIMQKARLFKGPLDDLRELPCIEFFGSKISACGPEIFFYIATEIGRFLMDKKQWEDKSKKVYNLISIKKRDNENIFVKIILKDKKSEKAVSGKENAELPTDTDLAPKPRLYQVEGLDKYFFVGFKKEKYFVDESGNFKWHIPSERCTIRTEGYTVQIFFGEYPQLKEKCTLESFYPIDSPTTTPYHLIGFNFRMSKLNLMKGQWTDEDNVLHKLVHVKKAGNEGFFEKIKLVTR